MNKLTKISIVAGAMVMGISSLAMAKFDDISESHYYYGPITNLVEKGIINGYPDNTFKPANKVTRAEFAKMISIAEELSTDKNKIESFNDIKEHWGKEYVELAVANELLKGYEDNTFRPDREISYGEVATIILRIMDLHEIADDNTNWPQNCMDYAEELGLFNGVATNDLIGKNPARRDNVALIIWNMMELKNKENEIYGDVTLELPKDDDEGKEEVNDVTNNEEIDTKKLYIGAIDKIIQRRGEHYVIVNEFNGTEREIKVNENAEMPDVHTLVMYKITEKGNINLKKRLPVNEAMNQDALIVEDVDKELIKFEGTDEILDLEAEEFIHEGATYKLDKYTFYLAEIQKNENDVYEFYDVNEYEREELKLEEKDRVIFDIKTKYAFVIRDLEN